MKVGRAEPRNDIPAPSFEVEIESGGRARDLGSPQRVANLSPTRAAAKSGARRRTWLLLGFSALALLLLGTWAWVSNPNSNVPSDAVARVNSELIYDRDVTRELDLTRMSTELDKNAQVQVPSPGSVLEELISRKIQVQDARKAGLTVSSAEVDAALKDVLSRASLTQEALTAALARHNLSLDDIRAVTADTYLVTKYINTTVTSGARTDQERQNRINDWQTNLAQNAKIERLKPVGSGPAPRIGSEAPDFTVKDLDGKEVKLSSMRGRPVMINFWATWCPPCRSEIPIIAEMYKSTHASGAYEILGVATQSDKPTIQAFAQEFGMTFPLIPDIDSRTTGLYHVLPIPTSFFIDKDGIIRDMRIGPVDRPLMEKWLLSKQ